MVIISAALLSGCDLLNPARPTPHDDTNLFGNLIEVSEDEEEDGVWWMRVRIGLPRAFTRAEAAEGKPTPTMEEGMVADVTVTADTVVLVEGRPGSVTDINPGSEVVVIPIPGTTRMVGTSNITVEAGYFTDFDTYRRWQLPGLLEEDDESEPREDPTAINSAGIEGAPVPVAGGRVLYFSARLRLPASAGGRWLGARRDGMEEPTGDQGAVERSYRTELAESGWSAPELVAFPGLDQSTAVRVSWVSGDEAVCLVSVVEPDGSSWVGRSERPSAATNWGPVEPMPELTNELPGDAAYLAGSATKVVYVARLTGSATTDLFLYDPEVSESPQLLTPPINSGASEWGPRVGPDNELFFVRGDRQMMVAAGEVRPVRLPTPHRTVVSQAAPTGDGQWVFLCQPRYTPGELDQDIYVARWLGENRIGEAMSVDEWRP
jgi:hypothetical protein